MAVERHREVITVAADSVIPHKVFRLGNPDRLVVDVPSLGLRNDIALPESYRGRLIKAIRYGQFNPTTSRLVFDLSQPINVDDIHEENEKDGRLMIEISAADDKASAPEANTARESREANLAKYVEPPKPKKVLTPSKPKKPVIVIDPGHGGVDPGTSGPAGSEEKDITLEYAKALKARLLKSGHYHVVLTRDDDDYITLRNRVDIARKAQATLFISLHADSASDLSARGLSVYTVSEKASDLESAALAARENKSDVLSGMDLSDESRDVADILISLAERDTKNRSATLADLLVTSLDDQVHLISNSHRFAGFAVLKAPDVPSVLVEIGFLTHPAEEKLIESKSYRDKVIGGIASGVDRYFVVEKHMGDQ